MFQRNVEEGRHIHAESTGISRVLGIHNLCLTVCVLDDGFLSFIFRSSFVHYSSMYSFSLRHNRRHLTALWCCVQLISHLAIQLTDSLLWLINRMCL